MSNKELTKDEQIKIGKRVLNINDVNEKYLKIKELEENDAIYMYQEVRGGGSLIMDYNGNYLFFTSSVNFDDALEKFRQGKRSNN